MGFKTMLACYLRPITMYIIRIATPYHFSTNTQRRWYFFILTKTCVFFSVLFPLLMYYHYEPPVSQTINSKNQFNYKQRSIHDAVFVSPKWPHGFVACCSLDSLFFCGILFKHRLHVTLFQSLVNFSNESNPQAVPQSLGSLLS